MEENNTQQKVEATPNMEAKTVDTQTTATKVENKNEEKVRTYSQEEFDRAMADTRRATERDTKKQLYKELDIKEGEEDKFSKYREAYEESLSDEEKRDEEFTQLQDDNVNLLIDLEKANYVIKALCKLTGKNESDVEKIVKMAMGLKTDDNTIDEALDEVMGMIKPNEPAVVVKSDSQTNVPVSQKFEQPSSTVVVDTQVNPWKQGQINLTEQGKIVKTNPELAKKLASEAGVKLNF